MSDNQDQSEDIKPPKVFIVPFVLLTVPSYLVGTIAAFAVIGFRCGMGSVLHIYFAKQRKAYLEAKAAAEERKAKMMAEAIERLLDEKGIEGTVSGAYVPPDSEDPENPLNN
jgi:hypothetical protein